MVTFEEDDYTRDLWHEKPRWIVSLSNSKKVIMDDGRPGLEPSAWVRLGRYLSENSGIKIEEMTIHFRSNKIDTLPKNAQGYFFSHGCRGGTPDTTKQRFIIGHLKDDVIYLQKYNCPEMILDGVETRDIYETPCLIKNS